MSSVDAPDDISDLEFQDRLERTQAALADAELVGLIAFADCWRAANVAYFTPFRPLDGVSDIALALLVLDLDAGPTLFVSEQTLAYAASETPFAVRPLHELGDTLRRLAGAHRGGRIGLAGEAYLPARLLARIGTGLEGVKLTPTRVLAELKAVKSAAEIALMRRAAELTDAAMAAIQDRLADGEPHTERELARLADATMIGAGADRTAYDSMVQAGVRSTYNLARPTDRVIAPGDLVMTDIGARYRGYVADGGRGFTYGPVDRDKVAIVEAAATAVEAGFAAARPGILSAELNAAIQQALVEQGYEPFSSEARGHGTGHGTGMDPEEECPWIGPDDRTVLQEDMVFTLKATITVPEVGGLRTERIVRLTASGCEPLDAFPMRLHW
jgi:Xaa-Pro aminopeptidase